MRKFELCLLCFDIEADKQFLILHILKEEPSAGEWHKTLAFKYQNKLVLRDRFEIQQLRIA